MTKPGSIELWVNSVGGGCSTSQPTNQLEVQNYVIVILKLKQVLEAENKNIAFMPYEFV